jgi:hypothetical protein
MKKSIFCLVFWAVCLSFTATAGNAAEDLIYRVSAFNPVQYKMALDDLEKSFPDRFKPEEQTYAALQKMSEQKADLLTRMKKNDKAAFKEAAELINLLDAQLLRNPLIEGKPVIAIKRNFGLKSTSRNGCQPGTSTFQFSKQLRNT